MERSFLYPAQDVLKHFEVVEHRGLSSAQVNKLREKHGSNG